MNTTKDKQFTFQGISYPVNPVQSDLVPSSDNFLKGSLNNKVLKSMMANINLNIPTLLVGPTGCGKTATVRWLASQTNNSYRRIQLNGSTNIDNFVGKWLINEQGTYWEDGILTDAMQKGHWLLLDEINAALPEILFVLNSILDDDKCLILDDKGKEVVKPHPDFRLFAAMNPWQEYAGTKELNRAQMDRFTIVNYKYPPPKSEAKIVEKHSKIEMSLGVVKDGDRGVIERMVELANIIREKNKNSEFVSVCSTRQLIQWAKLSEFLDIKHSAELTIINKSDIEEQSMVKDELNKLFKDKENLEDHRTRAENEKKKVIEKKKFTLEEEVLESDVTVEDSVIGVDLGDTTVDVELLKAKNIASEALESSADSVRFETETDPILEDLGEEEIEFIDNY